MEHFRQGQHSFRMPAGIFQISQLLEAESRDIARRQFGPKLIIFWESSTARRQYELAQKAFNRALAIPPRNTEREN